MKKAQPTPYLNWAETLVSIVRGSRHPRALALYLLLGAGHFAEHVAQLVQVYGRGWSPRAAGGLLGEWLPGLAASEVLHMGYNSLQLTGLILLFPGFKGRARTWWTVALVFQSWHFLEHVLLQVQFLTGYYLFNALKQTSLLEIFFPRLQLHFVYNLLVFIPIVVAGFLYVTQRRRDSRPLPEKAPWSDA